MTLLWRHAVIRSLRSETTGCKQLLFSHCYIMERVKVIVIMLIISTLAVNITEGKNALNVSCLILKTARKSEKTQICEGFSQMPQLLFSSFGSARFFRHRHSLRKEISCELFHNVANLVKWGTRKYSDDSSRRRKLYLMIKQCLNFLFSMQALHDCAPSNRARLTFDFLQVYPFATILPSTTRWQRYKESGRTTGRPRSVLPSCQRLRSTPILPILPTHPIHRPLFNTKQRDTNTINRSSTIR